MIVPSKIQEEPREIMSRRPDIPHDGSDRTTDRSQTPQLQRQQQQIFEHRQQRNATTETATPTTTTTTTVSTDSAVNSTNKSSAERFVHRFIGQQKSFTLQSTSKRDTESNVSQFPIFPDLLTHLMGMGSAKFWVNSIMGKVIPWLRDEAPEHCRWIEYLEDPSSAKFSDLERVVTLLRDPKKKKKFLSGLQRHQKDTPGIPFTYDVVYSVQTLCKGLGISNEALNNPEPSEAALEWMKTQILDRLTFQGDVADQFKFYRVFNARQQQFEVRFGMTNTALQRCTSHSRINGFFEVNVEKGFNDDGLAFTPTFYPQRFAVKDDMYSQYPIILDVLLHFVLNRYASAGVNYVEFSVGVSDLVTRPWIFTHLSRPQAPSQFGTLTVPAMPKRVTFRYLAAFDRRNVHATCLLNPMEKTYAEMAHAAAVIFDSASHFSAHLEILAKVKKRFAESRTSSENSNVRPLHEMCVGLDYVGDEQHLPYCSFAHKAFINFLLTERKERKERKERSSFGFRIHAGELMTNAPKYLKLHMGIVSTIICRILEAYRALWQLEHPLENEVPTSRPPPLRIANGTGFLSFTTSEDDVLPTVDPTKPPSTMAELGSKIQVALGLLQTLRIPIEVCPSFSKVMSGRNGGKALSTFLRKKFCVIVGTGNDGVFSTQLGEYHSVAAELVRAVQGTNEENKLQREEAESLLRNYMFAPFGLYHDVDPSKLLKNAETSGRTWNGALDRSACYAGCLVSLCFDRELWCCLIKTYALLHVQLDRPTRSSLRSNDKRTGGA